MVSQKHVTNTEISKNSDKIRLALKDQFRNFLLNGYIRGHYQDLLYLHDRCCHTTQIPKLFYSVIQACSEKEPPPVAAFSCPDTDFKPDIRRLQQGVALLHDRVV